MNGGNVLLEKFEVNRRIANDTFFRDSYFIFDLNKMHKNIGH